MQHKPNEQFKSKLEKFVNDNFEDKFLRKNFLNRFNSWPSSKIESWKLSRLGKLSRKEISPLLPNESDFDKNIKFLKRSYSLVFYDGIYRESLSDKLPENIEISFFEIKELEEFLNKCGNQEILSHPTLNITASCAKNYLKIKIKKNFSLDLPLEIIQYGGDSKHSIHPLILVELEENSALNLIQLYKSSSALIAPLEIVKVGKNSNLEIVKIFDDSDYCHNLSLTIKIIEENSECKSFNLIKGGAFSRSENHVFLKGESSSVDLNGVYLSSDDQHHDLTSVIYHNVPNCRSSQKVRGVLNNNSSGVFQGKVVVEKNAQKSDAHQMSRVLLLSDKANSNSKPELEIYADDVICSHGATVGELDEDQIFYLLSRGLNKEKAQHIMIDAFLTEIIEDSINAIYLENIKNETILGFKKILET